MDTIVAAVDELFKVGSPDAYHTVAATTFPADFLFPGTSGESVLTISQDASDEMKVRLLGPSDEDIPLEVFPNALWQPATAPDVVPAKEDP